jgi:dTDP-4-dehydrorhamnose reductase
MKIFLLGASGLLGHTIFLELISSGWNIYGSVREIKQVQGLIPDKYLKYLINNIDALDIISINQVIKNIKPDIIINCIGLIPKKCSEAHKLQSIEINSRFPHLLSDLAFEQKCRLIHYSTDCVFDGQKGEPYTEDDFCTARDIYGISKFLGEVTEQGSLTLRTSIIGHDLFGQKSNLIDWFLSQKNQINGYTKAIYTGLPAIEHANVLKNYILPDNKLSGLYHLVSKPISKFDLLNLTASIYSKKINIKQYDSVINDKTLSGHKFYAKTSYLAPNWDILVKKMYQNFLDIKRFQNEY